MTDDASASSRPAPNLLALDLKEIHLWFSPRDAPQSSEQLSRELLSRYAAVKPSAWRFRKGLRGRPMVTGSAIALDINISHSHAWTACAVSRERTVGVDLEWCDPDRDIMRIARRYFHPLEVTSLENASGEERRHRFYDHWTLKEAHVKCRGLAIAPALGTITFDLEQVEHAFSPAGARWLRNEEGRLGYCLLDIVPGHRLALSWLPAGDLAPRLRFFSYCGEAR